MATQTASTTQAVADELVAQCRQGKFREAIQNLYSKDVTSLEAAAPPGGSRETNGLEGVLQKAEWWEANHEVHSSVVEGPLVAGSHFAVTFKLDVTFKPKNQRFLLEEIAVYQVKDGKVVAEQFFYSM
jgi:hypothetical protein